MIGSSDPRTAKLRQEIKQLELSLDDLAEVLSSANDTSWRDAFQCEVEAANDVVELHMEEVQPSIADDAAALRTAFRRIPVPREDPDLGTLDRLYRLRNARGAVIADLDSVLIAADALGLKPAGLSLVPPTEIEFERAGFEGMLTGLEKRLRDVEGSLGDLQTADEVREEISIQQRGIINFYVRNMSVELALAKLEATAKAILDFASLARSVDTIGELTRDLVATVRAIPARFTETVRAGTAVMAKRVKGVTRGLRAIVYYVIGRAARSAGRDAQAAMGDLPLPSTDSFRTALAEGDRAMRQGALLVALEWYHAATHMALGRPTPGSPINTQLHLLTCYNLLGDVHRALNNLDSAQKRYGDALDVAERLARQEPGNVERQRDLSDSLDRLARVVEATGDAASAIIHYKRAETILDALAKGAPEDARSVSDLANIRARLTRLNS